jgi:hypothetical protein
MMANRKLAENVWYFVVTKVSDREPMFWSGCVSRMTECRSTSMPWIGLRLYASIGGSSRKNRSNFEKFEKKLQFSRFFRVGLKQNAYRIA